MIPWVLNTSPIIVSEYVSVFFYYYIFHFESIKFKSSRSQMSFKIDFFKNFSMFTGKHLRWSVFVIQLKICKPENLLKRDSNTNVFLLILLNLQEQLFFIEHLRWLVFKVIFETVRTSPSRTKKALSKLLWLLYWQFGPFSQLGRLFLLVTMDNDQVKSARKHYVNVKPVWPACVCIATMLE